jgi:excisionase family DNA binding protein
MAEADRLLTVSEVADRLRLGEETIRRWLRNGKLKGTLIGSKRAGYRIRESEVRRVESGGLATEEDAD